MPFSNEEIENEFEDESKRIPATARRTHTRDWMTDVTAGEDGKPVGIIGPVTPEDGE